MQLSEYQELARRSMSQQLDDPQRLTMTALGLMGEAGECGEVIKKHVFHGHPLDQAGMAKELGDVLWYVAMLADTCGLQLDAIAEQNIAKLRMRYPDGFSEAASRERQE
jgi:NTP pyrophosphatase (non-canonical NTP hydrolase)